MQARREVWRGLDRCEVAEDEEPATQCRVVPHAFVTFAQMALHRDHIRFGHGAIDERKVTLTEFAAVHGVGLESTGSGLLGVPDPTRRVPILSYCNELRTASKTPRKDTTGLPRGLARNSGFFTRVPAL